MTKPMQNLPDPDQWARHTLSALSRAMGNDASMIPLNPRHVDEKTVAERKWRAPLKPAKAQLPADVGLFSDDHLQLDLVEMLQEPANE